MVRKNKGMGYREAKGFIDLAFHQETTEMGLQYLIWDYAAIRWTPKLFEMVLQKGSAEPVPLITVAMRILELSSFEDAARLICAEAAKDPNCHPLLKDRSTFDISFTDNSGIAPELIKYLPRIMEARLSSMRKPTPR